MADAAELLDCLPGLRSGLGYPVTPDLASALAGARDDDRKAVEPRAAFGFGQGFGVCHASIIGQRKGQTHKIP